MYLSKILLFLKNLEKRGCHSYIINHNLLEIGMDSIFDNVGVVETEDAFDLLLASAFISWRTMACIAATT